MRTRQIHRDFWVSDSVSELSYFNRLLFIGLWGAADREGLVLNRPKRLRAEIFPHDDITSAKVKNGIADLASQGVIELLSIPCDVITCIYIPKFLEYQHIHPHEAKSKLACHYITGNVTKCKPTSTSTSTSDSASTGDTNGGVELESQVDEVIEYFKAVTGKTRVAVKADGNRKFVRARIRDDGVAVNDLKAIVDLKAGQVKEGRFKSRFLRIETLFNDSKCQSYLAELDGDFSEGHDGGKKSATEHNLELLRKRGL